MINVGTADRIIRFVAGVVLLLLPFVPSTAFAAMGMWKYAIAAVGGVLVLTAIFRFCPAYALLGVRTCDIGKK